MMRTSTQPVAPSRRTTNLALATLFSGMFVLGSGELLVVGLLNLIAADLRVSIPKAGVLVTAYALGLAIGGPILTALTIKLNKRMILTGTVVLVTGPGGQLASSLPASAANVGIALGAYAGGVAIGSFSASSAVVTGLIIAVISIPVAWAASFLKPPVIADATEPAVAADVTPEPA